MSLTKTSWSPWSPVIEAVLYFLFPRGRHPKTRTTGSDLPIRGPGLLETATLLKGLPGLKSYADGARDPTRASPIQTAQSRSAPGDVLRHDRYFRKSERRLSHY